MRLPCSFYVRSSTAAGTMSSYFTTHCSQISVSESKKNWNSSTSEMPPLKWARTLATDVAAGWSISTKRPQPLEHPFDRPSTTSFQTRGEKDGREAPLSHGLDSS